MFDEIFVIQNWFFFYTDSGAYIQLQVSNVDMRRDGSLLSLNPPSTFETSLFLHAVFHVDMQWRSKSLLVPVTSKTEMRMTFFMQTTFKDWRKERKVEKLHTWTSLYNVICYTINERRCFKD